MALLGLVKTKKQTEADRLKDLELAANKQKNLVEGLRIELNMASTRNTVFNLMDDGKSYYPEVEKIVISSMEKNGSEGNSTILVRVLDRGSSSAPLIVQIDINVIKNRIHLLLGPYGPEANFKIEHYEKLVKDLSKYVENFAYHGIFIKPTTNLRMRLFGV